MSEQELPLEELTRGFEAMGKRDWDAALSTSHPDMAWYEPPEVPDRRVHVGPEAIRSFWSERMFEAFEEWHLDLKELIPVGNKVLSIAEIHAKARHSGIDVAMKIFQVWTFEDGLCIEQRSFLNREHAFEAAGATDSER